MAIFRYKRCIESVQLHFIHERKREREQRRETNVADEGGGEMVDLECDKRMKISLLSSISIESGAL